MTEMLTVSRTEKVWKLFLLLPTLLIAPNTCPHSDVLKDDRKGKEW